MKNFKKTTFFVVISLILCFSLLSIFGFETKWGSTQNHPFKGIGLLNFDDELNDQVTIRLSHKKDLDAEQKEEIEEVLKKRAELLKLEKFKIFHSDDENLIEINLPSYHQKPTFDYFDIAKYLSAQGDLKIIKTTKGPFDFLFQKDKKDDKEEVLTDNSGIYSASLCYENDRKYRSSSKRKFPSVKFNMYDDEKEKLLDIYNTAAKKRKELFEIEKETKNLEKDVEKVKKSKQEKDDLEEKTEEDKKEAKQLQDEIDGLNKEIAELKKQSEAKRNEFSNLNIRIELDKESVFNGNILELVNDDMEIIGGNFQNSPSKVLGFVNIINSQKFPCQLEVVDAIKKSPTLGMDFKDVLFGSAVLAMAIFIILIAIKYRAFFALATIIFLGHISFMIASFSGFFSFFPGNCVNSASLLGICVSFLIGCSVLISILDRIVTDLKSGKDLYISVTQTFKKSKFMVSFNLIMLVLFGVISGVFAPEIDTFYYMFKPLNMLLKINSQNFIFSFSYAMFFGVLGVLIFNIIATRIILKLGSEIKFLRNPKLYGGKVK